MFPTIVTLFIFVVHHGNAFGHDLRHLFSFADGYTNLNQGSYGSLPKSVQKYQSDFRSRVESDPDRWYLFERYNELDTVRRRVAAYVSSDPDDLVFVENASHGVNAVLRSLALTQKKRKYLCLSIAYPMVKNTLQFLADVENDDIIQIPISSRELKNPQLIVDLVEKVLQSHSQDIAVFTFSHISSLPAVLLPAKELVDVCRRYGVLSLIDGAHAMGQIRLNLTEIDADFYVANGYKWLYSAKNSAVLHVRKNVQSMVFPTTISAEGKGSSRFQELFSFQGCMDDSPFMSFDAALDFRDQFGDEAIMEYSENVAKEGAQYLVNRWKTELLVPLEYSTALVSIVIPTTNVTCIKSWYWDLLEKYNTRVPVQVWEEKIYVRLSGQIFLEQSDFEFMGGVVEELIKDSGCNGQKMGPPQRNLYT